jgi:hypothetical protein
MTVGDPAFGPTHRRLRDALRKSYEAMGRVLLHDGCLIDPDSHEAICDAIEAAGAALEHLRPEGWDEVGPGHEFLDWIRSFFPASPPDHGRDVFTNPDLPTDEMERTP